MKHLNQASLAHKVMAGLAVVGTLITFGVGTSVLDKQPTPPWVTPLVLGAGVMSLVMAGLFFVVSGKLARGEGRTMATVLSVLQLGNCPGVLVAVYTIWVCWVNEETKAVFDAGGLGAGPATGAPFTGQLAAASDAATGGLGGSTREQSEGPLGGAT